MKTVKACTQKCTEECSLRQGEVHRRTSEVCPTCMPVVGTGRLSFISATPGGKSLRYQGCRWISGMVILLAGSGTKMCDSRSRHSLDTFTCAGNSYSTFSIRCKPQHPPHVHDNAQWFCDIISGLCCENTKYDANPILVLCAPVIPQQAVHTVPRESGSV